jgi:BirA family biotin operon repressor/biotin-[acetyl-CoA-carboxylase] ligase
MGFDVEYVRDRLPGRRVEWHETIDTTMRAAAAMAVEGCPEGSIAGAEQQTAGQGRLGRTWLSEPTHGLYCTFVLRPDVPPQQMPVVTLALGLAVADTVRLLGGVECDLKWPNDVLVGKRKLAGILTQYQEGAVLAGIGINVNQPRFPEDLAAVATSLRIETGREHRREPMLVYLAGAVDSYTRTLVTGGVDPIRRLFAAASSWVDGRRVTVDAPDGLITGTTAGLTREGFLEVQRDDGTVVTVHAGGVRAAGE